MKFLVRARPKAWTKDERIRARRVSRYLSWKLRQPALQADVQQAISDVLLHGSAFRNVRP